MVDDDVSGHYGFATVSFGTVHALLAKSFNSLAQHFNSFTGSVAVAIFLDELLHFTCNN